MATDHLEIDTNRLLWRTRGHRWDYTFLQRPSTPALAGWLHLFEQVFPPNMEGGDSSVVYRRGRILHRTAQGARAVLPFVAAALTDPERCDFAGRPVQHFFLYILEDDGDENQFSLGWEKSLLSALEPATQVVFSLERPPGESPVDFSERLLQKLRAVLPGHVSIPVGAGRVSWQRVDDFTPEDVRAKKVQAPPPPSTQMSGWVWALVMGLGLLLLWKNCRSEEKNYRTKQVLVLHSEMLFSLERNALPGLWSNLLSSTVLSKQSASWNSRFHDCGSAEPSSCFLRDLEPVA